MSSEEDYGDFDSSGRPNNNPMEDLINEGRLLFCCQNDQQVFTLEPFNIIFPVKLHLNLKRLN